jgi:hypothetical protein
MAVSNLSKFADKKVIVVHRVEGSTDAVETEGTAQAANEGGILLKPKGKTQMILIEAPAIEDVRFVDEKPKEIKRKLLKVVEFGQARNHLLERHGWTLKQVNEISEKAAYETHEKIDHVSADIGHEHGEKDKAEKAESDAA